MSLTVSQANDRLERFKARMATMRKEAKQAAKLGVASTVVVVGGALGGALDSKIGSFNAGGTEVKASVVVGTALVVASMVGVIDDETLNEQIAMAGAGMLAGHARDFAAKALA